MSAATSPRFFMDAPFVAGIWSADQGSLPTEAQYGQILARMAELHEQGSSTLKALLAELNHEARRNFYWQLRQINDALGIPTDSMEVLGVQQPVVGRIGA